MVGRLDGFEVLRATSLFEDLTLEEMRRFWEVAETRQAPRGAQVLASGSCLVLGVTGALSLNWNTGPSAVTD